MSGIEAAGIALALFPIVVKGIACYADGLQTVRAWRRYRREIAGYKRQLETQRIWYLDTLEELLGFVDAEEDLNELIANPGGASWRKPDYDKRLRERLDHSYDLYLATTRDLLDTLQIVQKKLGIDSTGKVPWEDSTSFKRQIERLKLVLSTNTYAKLIEKIERANVTLREFTHQNRHLEPLRRQRKDVKNRIRYFSKIRNSASSLHRVLVKKGDRCWRCVCRRDHVINIRLEPRTLDDPKESQSQQLRFHLLLSLKSSGKARADSVRTRWKELEVAPVELPRLAGEDIAHGNLHQPLLSSKRNTKAKKTVSFAIGDGCASTSGALGTAYTAETTILAHFSSLTMTSHISDICAAINCSSDSQKAPIGYLLDDEQPEHHRHDIFTAGHADVENIDFQTESLAHMLSSDQRVAQSITRHITRRDRLYLAALLATSVLQLDGSWLRRYWTSNDIYFTRETASKPIFDRPYISWRLDIGDKDQEATPVLNQQNIDNSVAHGETTSLSNPGTGLANKTAPPIPQPIISEQSPTHPHFSDEQVPENHLILSEVLFPLGLTLTELSLGRTLADLRLPEDEDSNETYVKLKTASRLLKHVNSESGPRYHDAVKKCLYWTDVRDDRFENEEFQKAVFESVVTPLAQDLRDFDGEAKVC
ncbi:MAG: hypothetical protein Q9160_008708 [Pyrenula sp. 1 TL-2023]